MTQIRRVREVADYQRNADDFYIEPAWCTERLLAACLFAGPIWDPCCGTGTIPKMIAARGMPDNAAGGSDLVYRGYGEGGRDFLTDPGPYYNLIFNPPFALAERFIQHALDVASCRVAVLVRIAFLVSQGRRARPDDY
jgi:hypothetical protein